MQALQSFPDSHRELFHSAAGTIKPQWDDILVTTLGDCWLDRLARDSVPVDTFVDAACVAVSVPLRRRNRTPC